MGGPLEDRILDGGPREELIGIGLDTGLACTVFPETRIVEPEEAVETDGPEQVGERESVGEQPRSGGRPEVAIEIGNQLFRIRDDGPNLRLVDVERGGGFRLPNLALVGFGENRVDV